MGATQKSVALKCFGEPMTVPAWKQKPSWFLIAEKDRMISADDATLHGRKDPSWGPLPGRGPYTARFGACRRRARDCRSSRSGSLSQRVLVTGSGQGMGNQINLMLYLKPRKENHEETSRKDGSGYRR